MSCPRRSSGSRKRSGTEFGVEISANEIGYEAVAMSFAPTELFEKVSATLFYETMVVEDFLGSLLMGERGGTGFLGPTSFPENEKWRCF